MQKGWRFFLGFLSIIAFLFGVVGMLSVSIYGGVFSVIGSVLLWPNIGDRVNSILGKKWTAFVFGVFFWLIVGPAVGVITSPTQVEIGHKLDNGKEEETLLGSISEEQLQEAQEWWQNRQKNLRAEQEIAATEWEEKSQQEFKKRHKQCFDKTAAYIMSRQFIEQKLKSPNTAKFPSFHADDVRVRDLGGCKFVVAAYVDAENSFGAMIRTNYSISMEYLPAEKLWRGSELKM